MIKKFDINIIVPVYNEGSKVLRLVKNLKINVKYNFQILFCFDNFNDDIFKYQILLKKIYNNIEFIKNPGKGPGTAIKAGLNNFQSNCSIVYPADDLINYHLINQMYELYLLGYDIVVPSRFIKGGSMKKCPLIKELIVRFVSFFLYFTKSVNVKDSTNGFRLFSKKILTSIEIESQLGFAYSIELLVKATKKKFKITELPSKWEERNDGSRSRFKILEWFPDYFKWFLYGIFK